METWQDWYQRDAVGVYGLLVVPAFFLVYLALTHFSRPAPGGAGRFVYVYTVLFTLAALLDPIAVGLLVREAPPPVATATSLLFVLLGDFRVFLLVLYLGEEGSRPARAAARAALLTPIVPIAAYGLRAVFDALWGPVPGQVLWLTHELLFVGMGLLLLRRFGAHALVHRCLLFVVLYYALWASADVMILLGLDVGWLLRVLPNQLYYAFYTPFVWFASRGAVAVR